MCGCEHALENVKLWEIVDFRNWRKICVRAGARLENVECCFVWRMIYYWGQGGLCPFFITASFLLQVRDVQQVIKLTKKNLDELNRQFENCRHPPSMYMEVGSNLFCNENCYDCAVLRVLYDSGVIILKDKKEIFHFKTFLCILNSLCISSFLLM